MKHLASIIGLLSLLVFAAPASAQDNDITNEYRATLVTSKPVSDKVVLFTYLGYVNSPDKDVKTLYYSPQSEQQHDVDAALPQSLWDQSASRER